jgi:hypothetical protein
MKSSKVRRIKWNTASLSSLAGVSPPASSASLCSIFSRLLFAASQVRACLKNVKTPKQRIFFRCTALKILEIRQDSCEFLPCPAKKSLAVGHSAIYQTSPNRLYPVNKLPPAA